MHLSEEVRLLTAKLAAAEDKTQARLVQVRARLPPVFPNGYCLFLVDGIVPSDPRHRLPMNFGKNTVSRGLTETRPAKG